MAVAMVANVKEDISIRAALIEFCNALAQRG